MDKIINSDNLKIIKHDEILFADKFLLESKDDNAKKKLMQTWIHDLLYCKINIPFKENELDFVFFRSFIRDDYRLFFSDVFSCVKHGNNIIIEDYKIKSSEINAEASRFLISMKKFYYSFSANTPYDRACMYVRLCYYYLVFSHVAKLKFKNIVFFSDMQPVENLIAQYARMSGKTTMTLQHGLYVDYGDYETVNAINYLHQPSEYFLSWGEDTKATIQKYHPETKIVICGKPRITLPTEVKIEGENQVKGKYLTAVLDQRIFDEQNISMLKVASDYAKIAGYNLNVRFHPSNDKKIYNALDIDFIEDQSIKDSEFVVGHTSSLIYEALNLGIPSYKYESTIPSLQLPHELVFSSVEQLQKCLAENHDFKKIGKKYISFSGDESKVKYTNFFDTIYKNSCEKMFSPISLEI